MESHKKEQSLESWVLESWGELTVPAYFEMLMTKQKSSEVWCREQRVFVLGWAGPGFTSTGHASQSSLPPWLGQAGLGQAELDQAVLDLGLSDLTPGQQLFHSWQEASFQSPGSASPSCASSVPSHGISLNSSSHSSSPPCVSHFSPCSLL